ncbi:ricin B lectin domain-containing protein [Mycena vitilis]|nr:ricin B lectin domain-containing protein [Mycena vitilis]
MQLSALLALALASAAAAATIKQDVFTIHPNGDKSKCVGVLGGAFVVGAAIDIYDCNGSATQKWYSTSGPRMTNPADKSEWALDIAHKAGASSVALTNGVKAVLNKSADGGEDGSPYQSWSGRSSPNIRLGISSGKEMCLDLTGGSKTNRNALQIWECVKGNTNQVWTYTVVGQK